MTISSTLYDAEPTIVGTTDREDSNNALIARQLSCVRGDRTIFEDVNLTLSPGELSLILGQNGCGKSTLLRLFAGLLSPTTGVVTWPDCTTKGRDKLHYIGHVGGNRGMLTAAENLALHQRLSNTPVDPQSINAALDTVGLKANSKLLCNQLSAGQQRRIALARLILIPAKVWILDEPTTALDRKTSQLFRQWIEDHLHNGGMVVMATHTSVDGIGARTQQITLDDHRE